jgi:hypothetical protein
MVVPRARTAGAVVAALEGHELGDGRHRLRVGRDEPQLRPARQVAHPVPDGTPPLRHHRGSRNLARVHEGGGCEIAGRESPGDLAQVPANHGHAVRVIHVALKLDAAPVREGVEPVGRGVLVHSHGLEATTLNRRERAVGILRASGHGGVVVGLLRGERRPHEQHQGRGGTQHRVSSCVRVTVARAFRAVSPTLRTCQREHRNRCSTASPADDRS